MWHSRTEIKHCGATGLQIIFSRWKKLNIIYVVSFFLVKRKCRNGQLLLLVLISITVQLYRKWMKICSCCIQIRAARDTCRVIFYWVFGVWTFWGLFLHLLSDVGIFLSEDWNKPPASVSFCVHRKKGYFRLSIHFSFFNKENKVICRQRLNLAAEQLDSRGSHMFRTLWLPAVCLEFVSMATDQTVWLQP